MLNVKQMLDITTYHDISELNPSLTLNGPTKYQQVKVGNIWTVKFLKQRLSLKEIEQKRGDEKNRMMDVIKNKNEDGKEFKINIEKQWTLSPPSGRQVTNRFFF